MNSNTSSSGANEEGPLGDAIVVIFNLDTTEENIKTAEICQIAAWCNGEEFNVYILPNGRTLFQFVNGFKIMDNKLFHYGMEVNAVSPKDGLQFFLKFLSDLTGNSCKILLSAHNCSTFHRHIIIRLMKQYGLLDTFKSLVLGFIDTVHAFKDILSERAKEKKSFGLEELKNDYLNTISKPKHAGVKVAILVDLIEQIHCTDVIMKQHVKYLDEFIRYIDLKSDFDGAVPDEILKKIALAGITTDMLKDAHKREGVSKLLQDKQVRVANATIGKITERVAQLCANSDGNGTA